MQKSNWLRIGFVSALALAGATTAIACGGDDEVEPSTDGGPTSSSSGDNDTDGAASSSGTISSSSGGSSGAPKIPAALAVVHGFNALGPVKICYAISKTAVPEVGAGLSAIAPLPAGPGLLPGSGGILPGTGLVLSEYNIRPYLIKVASIGANVNAQCPELIGAEATVQPALVEGTDWYSLEPLTVGQLKDESTFVLIARESATTAGKPAAELFELDTTTAVGADQVGVQFIHGSNYFGLATGGTAVAPFIDRPEVDQDAGSDAGDAGGPQPGRSFEYILGDTNATKVEPFAAISTVKLTDAIVTKANTGFGVQVGTLNTTLLNTTGLGGTGDLIPVAAWANLSDPNKTQGPDADTLYFKPGNSFTFIAVGDPTAPPPANSPPTTPEDALRTYARPHFLVFPNKPLVPGL